MTVRKRCAKQAEEQFEISSMHAFKYAEVRKPQKQNGKMKRHQLLTSQAAGQSAAKSGEVSECQS